MQFDISIKQEERTTGIFWKKHYKWIQLNWKIILTPEEQKIAPYIGGTALDTTVGDFSDSKLYSDPSARAILDSPIIWRVEDFLGEHRGKSFNTPGEAREYEKKLRYEIFPKIEAILDNNRPL